MSFQDKLYLKNALKSKQPGIGFWLTLNAPGVIKSVLSGGGFNWVLVDAEHGQITDSDYYVANNLIASAGASPIIRVPVDQEWHIKRALDSGAHGVMTPMCHTADDARRIVSYCKYPPLGTRGFGPMYSAHSFGTVEKDYAPQADDGLLTIVQIESRSAVENVEEIAKVEGIDVLFIGPFDLSKFLGCQFGGEEHEAAIARVLKAAHAAGKIAAIFTLSGEQSKKRLEQGFDMVSVATDQSSLVKAFEAEIAVLKGVQVGESRSAY